MAGPYAWRLTFSYRGETLDLVSQERVEMTAPPSDEGDSGGVRLEVHDADGRVVWHQRIRDPIVRTRAVFSPDPDEPIRQVEMPEPEGAFQVVVPDLPGAETFVLLGQPSSAGRTARRPGGARPESTGATRAMARVRLGDGPDRSKGTRKP